MNKLFQVSLFQSLTLGVFDGEISAKEFRKHGDCGIGTYAGVNGELIMLDGTLYQAFADGTVAVAPDTETIPYAATSFFTKDYQREISTTDFEDLTTKLNAIANELGKNMCYLIKLHANFEKIVVRSILKQSRPYKQLNEVVKTDQKEFTRENIDGTIVGLYCPAFMSGLNVAGWHCHFVADDLSIGGHVFDACFSAADLQIEKISEYELFIPDNIEFNEKDFSQDLSKAIEEAEKRTKAVYNLGKRK